MDYAKIITRRSRKSGQGISISAQTPGMTPIQKIVGLGLALALVTGINSARAQESAFAAPAKALLEQCQSMRLSGQVRGYVGSAKCSNPGLAQLAETYRIADSDIVALYLAKRLEIAERMDAGRLTEGQGQVEMARAYQEASQMQLARSQSSLAAAAQARAQTEAAALAAQAQRQQSIERGLQALQNTFGPQNYWVPQFPKPAAQQNLTCSLNRSPSLFGPTLNCN
jgi:hypothetical protein